MGVGMKKIILALALAGALSGSTAATAAAPTVTLQVDRDTITFGGTVSLTGQVSPAAADQQVTITQTPMNRAARATQATTASDGTFSLDVSPRFNTRVEAKYGTATSDEQTIFVRPRVSLRKYGARRFAAVVVAGRPFVGRYAWLTRWNVRRHAWTNIKRLYLNHYVKSTGATSVAFRMRVRRGVKLRVFLNNVAARPDYVRAWSNFVVS
jgi:hypothetical protein